MNPDPARAVRQDSPVYTHTFSAWCPNVDFWLAFSLSDIMIGFLGWKHLNTGHQTWKITVH